MSSLDGSGKRFELVFLLVSILRFGLGNEDGDGDGDEDGATGWNVGSVDGSTMKRNF